MDDLRRRPRILKDPNRRKHFDRWNSYLTAALMHALIERSRDAARPLREKVLVSWTHLAGFFCCRVRRRGEIAMPPDFTRTSPTLLKNASDWHDHEAWGELQRRYDGLLRACCKSLHLDDNAIDEVCQEAWFQVAKRLANFVYDPGGSFRKWLWTVCRYEGLKFLKARREDPLIFVDGQGDLLSGLGLGHGSPPSEIMDAEDREPLLDVIEAKIAAVQERVKRRGKPIVWECFRLISMEFYTPREAADILGITYSSAWKNNQRVLEKLLAEAHREFGEMTTFQ